MKSALLMTFVLASQFGASTWAAESGKNSDKASAAAAVSKDAREKMAQAHEQMALCLKSDKTFEECHESLQKECTMMGDSCPGMGMGKGMGQGMGQGMGRGMGQGKGMQKNKGSGK